MSEHEGLAGASSSKAGAFAPCLGLGHRLPQDTTPPLRTPLQDRVSSSLAFLQPASPTAHLPRYL